MKRLSLIFIFFLIAAAHLHAQKLMTRTGKISFFSSTPVENIEAFNNDVSCVLNTQNGELVFVVPIKSFRFEKQLMKEHFNESYMESDKYPKAQFKGKIADLRTIHFSKDGSYPAKTTGKLTIHGITKEVSIPGSVVVKNGKVTLTSTFKVKTADYHIQIPSLTSDKIAKEIEVSVNSILEAK